MHEQSILIIDDRKMLARNYSEWLRSRGWKPQVALTARDGIEAYRVNAFDIVLLDMLLPDMNGFEVFTSLKSIDLDVCVVFHTAYGDIPSAVRALQLGGVDFVEKPVANEILLEKLRRALEAKRNAIEARAKLKAEAELVEQSKTLTLVAGMAHKINGKLAAIRANQGLLERRGAEAEWREKAIRRTQQICDACHTSLRVFSMLVKKRAMPQGPISIKTAVQEASRAAHLASEISGAALEKPSVKYFIPEDLMVLANADVLEAALACLLENAMEASPPGAEIVTRVSQDLNGLLCIRIEDRGHGFHETLLQKEITPFTSTRSDFGHLGFGLYFAAEVAKFYGGNLSFGNLPDRGAFVNFKIKECEQPIYEHPTISRG